MNPLSIYHPEMPAVLADLADAPELQRLESVGMNCGCEYTRFPRFRGLKPYSRRRHSISTALIVWHFTGDLAQSAAALFHDVATPVFAHVVDFLRGDYLTQESTEEGTERILRRSPHILRWLEESGLDIDDICDYHRYPIADNDSPRLSADRLEYTLGNLENFGFRSPDALKAYYAALVVDTAEDGAPELSFSDADAALAFGLDALKCSRIYVSGEDRYAMQRLAELLGFAMERGVLAEADLYTTEPEVIARLEADPVTRERWRRYCAYREMVTDPEQAPASERRVIPAKKRYIDPSVRGRGRLSEISPVFRSEAEAFLAEPQDRWLCAR